MRKFCVLFIVISWVIMLPPACSDESDTSSDLDGDTDPEFLEMEEEFENGISDGNEIDGDEDFTETETDISSGEFGLLTYNVAGSSGRIVVLESGSQYSPDQPDAQCL